MSKYMDTKTGSLEESILGIWQEAAKKQQSETNKNDKSDDGEGMDAVQPKAVKKKFDDRKDKDIDNDGDTDSSDEFLHKKRKAISKAISKDEGNAFGKALKDAKEKGDKTFVVSGKEYKVKEELAKENFEVGTKSRRDHTLNTTPGQSPEEFDQQVGVMQAKNNYMREALAKMWGLPEGHNPFKDKKEEKKPKVEKTMTGKKATEVKVDPDLDENKELDKMKKETKLKGKNLQAACAATEAPPM
jgi:hypothetical protein